MAKGSHHHLSTAAIEDILRDKQEEIVELISQITAGENDVAVLLAQILDGEPEHVRIAIVEKLRDMLQERDEEKATELDKIIAQQKQLLQAQQKNVFQRWLMWVMSEETLRKIRESFMARPMTQHQVEHTGQDLAKKGVIGVNIEQPQQGLEVSRRELGNLVANVSAALGQAKGKGQGRQ
ncbi:MAG: hypothetical protein ACOYJ2_08600 [Rickettsiales bacterium]